VPSPAGPGPIRHAHPREFGLLREIEAASDEMFADVGMGPFSQSDEEDHLAQAALVIVAGDPPVGFASVEVVDDAAHIWQLSVLPAEGRRGRGTALVQAVCAWATGQGFDAVTLTTYRDVPWNAPFYARLGFVVVAEQDLSRGLVAIRVHERVAGDDDFGPRVAMRKVLRSR
jgi:GNAT superfamily N-acetyltransferase